MCGARVLAVLALLVSSTRSFSWDIVVGGKTQLDFYNNGLLTHTEVISSTRNIHSVTYDPAHYRVLFAGYNYSHVSIYSFDLSNNKTECLLTRKTNSYVRVVYEPVTRTLYWRAYSSIYSFSLNPASYNKADGNLLFRLDNIFCNDLAVDSCGGYIYWITDSEIERARLDGSEREVLIDSKVYSRRSLAIDQQTQKMYWTENTDGNYDHMYIESANFNGKNRETLHNIRNTLFAFSLAVSKDFIYWQKRDEQGIWRIPKYPSQTMATKLHLMSSSDCQSCHRIATNYTIEEQTQGIKSCGALQRLLLCDSKSERTVCQNYCIQGECSVSAEGLPTCSCIAGYSGERCEVNACLDYCLHGGVCSLSEDNKRVCQCRAGYEGERCEVSICKDYCVQGNCSVGADGQPICSCKAGYSGERCEVNTCCHEYCLNGGFCFLNEEDAPAYQDTAGYDGGRCEVSPNKDNSSDEGISGEGTVSSCHQFCLNDGVCSLSEARAPVCQCTADYAGERCDVLAFLAKWVYKHAPPVTVSEVKSPRASTVVATTKLVRNEREV